jgi:ribosomal protein S18 acetylase RimI-like enzyme
VNANIRPACSDDVGALRALLVETWHATYDPILGAAKVTEITDRWHSIANLARQIETAVLAPTVHGLLIGESDGQLVGTVKLDRQDRHTLELSRLYVHPTAQGCGLGRDLLAAALARLGPAQRITLEVEPENIKAITFYARLGFRQISTSSTCGGNQNIAVTHMEMEADLPLFLLRPAVDSDAQDLFGLMALCFAEYPGCFVDPHGDLPDLVKPGRWRERARAMPDGSSRRLGGEFLVLEDETGRISACVAVDFPSHGPDGRIAAELHRLYVRPDCRRRGIAQRLVAEAERMASKGGAVRIFLWSDTRFIDAHRLYARLGYAKMDIPRKLDDISNSREYGFEKSLVPGGSLVLSEFDHSAPFFWLR